MSAPPQPTTDRPSGRHPEQPSVRGADALRELIRCYAHDGATGVSDDSWRRAARLMSEDARAGGARVEELLVGVKRTWPTFAERERLPRSESSHLLSRFVTLCVEEYYGPLD
jgi:hypothetical protein